MGLNMSLNTYASIGLVPFMLSLQWLASSVIHYAQAGCLVAFAFNVKMKSINRDA
jgi:hypothetical protein